MKIGSNYLLVLSIYRPPKQKRKGNESSLQDLKSVEEELNHICQWACFQKQSVIILGYCNLDRLRLDPVEGKLLKDLEEVNNLQCTITEPTRVTAHSESLLDVILTNNPDLFKKCGAYQQNALHMNANLSFRLICISGYRFIISHSFVEEECAEN